MGESAPVILFDGVCNLCNASVQFVINRDKRGKFRFAALQSEAAKALLKNFKGSTQELTTAILVKDNTYFVKSDAALEVARSLSGGWPLLYGFKILPSSFRNWIYDWISRNRYRWFGKKDECMIPTPELKQRFLN